VDGSTGNLAFSVQTTEPGDVRYITGAPRVFNDKVIIGHGGADFGAVRGYVTAYDAATGRLAWRFYTVPGDPAKGFENDAMAMAAKTWTGEWWKHGGGGTVWNAITYDPEYNRVYIGTGNGAPWNRKIRSPGGGDNLFLCSVVALDADTGKYIWHYQTSPGETWDFTSTMDMVLATVDIAGAQRKVIMHAPKNGFFYVIDRETGKLISAEKVVKVTWADRIDPATGRPVETPNSRYESGETVIWPGSLGAHNWPPMAYNPQTRLAYIPVREMAGYYNDKGIDPARWNELTGPINGVNFPPADVPVDAGSSALLAWDPLTQTQAWRLPTPGFWNGGLLSTAGNLIFQGQADGRLVAHAADTGRVLWYFDLGVGTIAPPITYQVDGKQYVSILAGWAGGPMLLGSLAAQHGWVGRDHPRRLLSFVLDGNANMPPSPSPSIPRPIDDPAFVPNPAKRQSGEQLYLKHCGVCHGASAVAGGYVPDLRASPVPLSAAAFEPVVRGGALELRGMPKFGEFTDGDLDMLRFYIRARAHEALEPKPAQ
jgi:quinohemoprotein ethanol dehydrogenase